MTKARILKQEFFIGFNTVVCVLTSKISINADSIDMQTKVFKVKGKAKCSPEDLFDIETGKIIAESKAFEKLYRKTNKLLADVLNHVTAASRIIKADIDKHTNLILEEMEQQKAENVAISVNKRKEAIKRRCGKE